MSLDLDLRAGRATPEVRVVLSALVTVPVVVPTGVTVPVVAAGTMGPPGAVGPPGPPGPQGPPGEGAGTGLSGIRGTLPSTLDLPDDAELGDAWIIDGYLWVWR